ncbi:MAG: tryptophan synthase subunit alpha [Dehalococcoidales bacterium]|nr:tryptophan synthase subunit alpha [Dehalococcoidales bacterium]
MNQIASVFRRPGHKALIAYVTVGYPSIEATLEVVPILAGNGCDIVELGIPFSDPLADGATIQKASFQALQNGVTPLICLDIAAQLSRRVSIPLMFMTYFNPVLSYGLEKFSRDCASAGIHGLIVPDLPPEEGTELEAATRKHGIDLVYLLAPTSTDERIHLVASQSRGFIYLVSITGVTGARNALSPDLGAFVARVKKIASQPVCVGFGISTPEQARQVAEIADGVIVGSRIIQLMETRNEAMTELSDFIRDLRSAIDSRRD